MKGNNMPGRKKPNVWALPPHVKTTARNRTWFKTALQPTLIPSRRNIALFSLLPILTGCILTFLLAPSILLVNKLKQDGVVTTAQVERANLRAHDVQLSLRPAEASDTTTTRLSEFAGFLPNLREGSSIEVVYLRSDPRKVLTRDWVDSPPYSRTPLIVIGSTQAVTTLVTIALIARRIQLLRRVRAIPAAPPGLEHLHPRKRMLGKS